MEFDKNPRSQGGGFCFWGDVNRVVACVMRTKLCVEERKRAHDARYNCVVHVGRNGSIIAPDVV